jgi:hypothetical protein
MTDGTPATGIKSTSDSSRSVIGSCELSFLLCQLFLDEWQDLRMDSKLLLEYFFLHPDQIMESVRSKAFQ